MTDEINIELTKRELSPKALDLLQVLIDSVSPNSRYAYCCGGEIDTQIVPFDFTDKKRVKIPAKINIQTSYIGAAPETASVAFFDCEVREARRVVTTTIKDGIWRYDITFADKAVVLVCEPLRAPQEVPNIYEMCWYGRKIAHINQYMNTTTSVANILKETAR